MPYLVTALCAVALSVLSGCFALVWDSPALFALTVIAFVLLNLLPGLLSSPTNSLRLRFLCHGNMMLLSFCLSVITAVTVHILALVGVFKFTEKEFLFSIIYSVITCAVTFWNGIASVYLTSVQLGIKHRVIGAVCGLIPMVNLFVLGRIIYITCREFSFEFKKEKLNEERRGERICATEYPILLVHGVFFRDRKCFNYWGRIPAELKQNGATCFYGEHQSAASVADSAQELADRIKQIVEETGCEKLNIIAHSKGGLDCRYAMAHCGISHLVASVTTVNTPHRGCMFADWLLEHAPDSVKNAAALYYNKAAWFLGDKKPDFLAAVSQLGSGFCTDFDKNTPAPDGVLCQSIGSVMEKAASGRFPLNL